MNPIVDRAEALSALRSARANDRLSAARYFVRSAVPTDAELLRQALQTESAHWVRAALATALGAIQAATDGDSGTRHEEMPADSADDPSTEAAAIQMAAQLVLHELSGPVGRLDAYASFEVPEFDASKTRRELVLLRLKLDAIVRLAKASETPLIAEIDLAALMQNLAASLDSPGIEISVVGPSPLLIKSDASLIELIASQGLRNAIEATQLLDPANRGPIVVSWGLTDRDAYLRVSDQGHGVTEPLEALAKWGKTSKRGKGGYGLAAAQRAAQSLHGEISLRNRPSRGAQYEFRWAVARE